MSYNKHLSEMNGYLNALQRICGSKYVFGVTEVPLSSEGNESIKLYIKKVKSCLAVRETNEFNYQELASNLNKVLYRCINRILMLDENRWGVLSRGILDDINEYFGLISTTLNKDGIFYPLKKNKLSLYMSNSCGEDAEIFFSVDVELHRYFFYMFKK